MDTKKIIGAVLAAAIAFGIGMAGSKLGYDLKGAICGDSQQVAK